MGADLRGSETSEVVSAYIPVQHFDVTNLPWETVRAALQPIFADPKITKVAHNASYDLAMLARYGLNVAGELVDTMVAEWLIDPGSRGLGSEGPGLDAAQDRDDPHHAR